MNGFGASDGLWFTQPRDAAALAAAPFSFSPKDGKLGRSLGSAYFSLPTVMCTSLAAGRTYGVFTSGRTGWRVAEPELEYVRGLSTSISPGDWPHHPSSGCVINVREV